MRRTKRHRWPLLQQQLLHLLLLLLLHRGECYVGMETNAAPSVCTSWMSGWMDECRSAADGDGGEHDEDGLMMYVDIVPDGQRHGQGQDQDQAKEEEAAVDSTQDKKDTKGKDTQKVRAHPDPYIFMRVCVPP